MPRLPIAKRLRPRVRRLFVLISVSAVAIASPAFSQNTPQRPEPQPTGSARITGRVLASDNGAPVRRARVRLSGSPAETGTAGAKPPYVQREVETDDNGAFDFAGLRPAYSQLQPSAKSLDVEAKRHPIVSALSRAEVRAPLNQ